MVTFHEEMDNKIEARNRIIEQALEKWNADKAWRTIATAIELAFIDNLEGEEEDAKRYKGHGI